VKIQAESADEPTLYVWCQRDGIYLFCSNPTLHYHYIVKMTHSQASAWKYHWPKLKFDLESVKKVSCTVLFNNISFFCKTNLTFVLHLLFQFVSLYKMPPMEPSVNTVPSEAIPCAFFALENGHFTGEVVYLCLSTCFIYESLQCILMKFYNDHTKICRPNSISLCQYING
jgi:hypothetical protein